MNANRYFNGLLLIVVRRRRRRSFSFCIVGVLPLAEPTAQQQRQQTKTHTYPIISQLKSEFMCRNEQRFKQQQKIQQLQQQQQRLV